MPKCSICQKPCDRSDGNSDGTYAHDHCLRLTSLRPVGRGEKGNLYPSAFAPPTMSPEKR